MVRRFLRKGRGDAFLMLRFEGGLGKIAFDFRTLSFGGLRFGASGLAWLGDIDDDGAAPIKLVDHGGAEELSEPVFVHALCLAFDGFFIEQREDLRQKKEETIIGCEPTAGDLDEGLDRMLRGIRRSESFADMRERTVAEEIDAAIAGSGEMDGVFFDDRYGAVELAEPVDIAMFDDLSEGDVDLMERRFEAFHGAAPRIAEVFVLGDGEKEIDDILGILALVIDLKNTKQDAERSASDIIVFVPENLYEVFGIPSSGRLDLRNDTVVLLKRLWFFSFSFPHSFIFLVYHNFRLVSGLICGFFR